MKELIQVQQAVIRALKDAGVETIEAYPDSRAKAYTGAVATVAVGTVEGKTMGFCNYLGEVYDDAVGTVRELYGKQLEGSIAVDIRADRAADCESGSQKVSEVMMCGLPSGIRPGELCWEAMTWEKATGMFLRKGSLQCQSVFVAQSQEDGELFLDFILKGVRQT
jgi:hypothetical protein